ncbi:MAG: hypothetical protein WC645_03340 [Candidatus Margulisiibacteriota bacterium]
MRIEPRNYRYFQRFDPSLPRSLNRPFLIDGRKLPSTPPPHHPTPVEAWPVTKLNQQIEYLPREEKDARLKQGKIAFAFKPDQNREYLVAEEAFDKHAQEIYLYESRQALARIERSCQLLKSPNLELRKRIFRNVEDAIIKRWVGSPKQYRHLTFLLRELSNTGCDFLTATAALMHNLPRQEAKRMMTAGQKDSDGLRKLADQILDIVELFSKMNETHYSPPHKKLQNHTQNFLNALINIARGNGRALLLYFVHKLSAITQQTEDAGDITFKSVEQFIAPSAERLGLQQLASKLRHEAFRLYDPENFRITETGILRSLGLIDNKEAETCGRADMDILLGLGVISKENAKVYHGERAETLVELGAVDQAGYRQFKKVESDIVSRLRQARKKAEDLTDETKQALMESFAKNKSLVQDEARVKTAYDAWEKTRRKPDEYPEPLCMEDLIGARIVTPTLPTLVEAKKIVRKALGNDIRFLEKQTEIKIHQTRGGEVRAVHLGVILPDNNSREIQILDPENFKILERGLLAHWAHKLEETTDQKFDRDFLEECAQEMNGDIVDDAKVIFKKLQPWIFAFFEEEKHVRVIRCRKGSIPIDMLYWFERRDFSKYAGFKKRKIWDKDNWTKRTEEKKELEDGDFLELDTDTPVQLGKEYLTPHMRRELFELSKDPFTKIMLHFFGNEDGLREAAQRGEEKFISVSGKPSNRFSGFKEFALRRYQMYTWELLAAIELGILSPKEVLADLNQFFLAELASK